MLGASIDRDRSARFRTAAFKRRCRRIDLFVKRPSVNVQWVRKNGHRPERGEWIFGTANRVPRSGTFSLLLVLSFNLVAHLHRRVLTRRTLQQAFPRAFHQPARKFRATLIYLDRDRLHDTYFFFLFFRSPFSVLRAERPSVIRARPPAVNVARSWKNNIPPCSGIREQKLGSLAVVHDGNTVSSWQFTGLTTRLREPRFAATCVSSRFHFVLFRGRKSSALNFKRDVSIEWIWCLSVVVFAQFTSEYTL